MTNPNDRRCSAKPVTAWHWLASLALASTACGSAVAPDGSVQPDAAADSPSADARVVPPVDSNVDGGAPLCTTGSQRRMEINGVVSETASVAAMAMFLSCCDAAAIQFTSARFTDSLAIVWRVQVGSMPALPTTVDVANLPRGWSVEVWAGCSPATTGCTPTDRFDTGLTGSLTVARTDATGTYRMNACVSFNENPAAPHASIHSLRLASGEVTAP